MARRGLGSAFTRRGLGGAATVGASGVTAVCAGIVRCASGMMLWYMVALHAYGTVTVHTYNATSVCARFGCVHQLKGCSLVSTYQSR